MNRLFSFSSRHRHGPQVAGPRAPRRAMTIVEMLVAMVVSLILIFALVQVFELIGESVSNARAAIEMSSALRNASHRIQEDLEGITVPVRPWASSAGGQGYFEYTEFSEDDNTYAAADILNSRYGDLDDVIAFTTRSTGKPFVGRIRDTYVGGTTGNYVSITSMVAEVIMWTQYDDLNGSNTRDPGEPSDLHRRVLLVRPDINGLGADPQIIDSAGNRPNSVTNFILENDISVHMHYDSAGRRVGVKASSLTDLTNRRHRFIHHAKIYPYPMALTSDSFWPTYPASSPDYGRDILLSDVMAFDIRVYDPLAVIRTGTDVDGNTIALSPGDPGYAASAASATPPRGAFVDLGYESAAFPTPPQMPTSHFSHGANPKSRCGLPMYCTWTAHFESDGVDQDQDGVVDEGTDGLDNDGVNGVDDAGERETAPPYEHPLRGLQITLRVYEPDTRQIRQATVVSDFTPE